MSLKLLLGGFLLLGACSADQGSDVRPRQYGGAGSAGGGAGGITAAGTSGMAGGMSGSGGASGGVAGSSAQSGASNGGTIGLSGGAGGTAGGVGGGPHAGADCAPGTGTGFDTSFDGVVVDRNTCLIWERPDPARDMTACALKRPDILSSLCWSEAQSYCKALGLDGQSDWRLPTVLELQTLVASPPPTPPAIPTVDHDAFPEAVANLYWTSEMTGGKVHCVDFNGGPVTNNTGPDGPQAFRCVRGP